MKSKLGYAKHLVKFLLAEIVKHQHERVIQTKNKDSNLGFVPDIFCTMCIIECAQCLFQAVYGR